ncbi:heme NO-binding domain-containing protein [Ferrimonas sp. YFM]|uniref:heme NO-binding domain-containing protein n=1 Tax=Ferrimonas sp. YFM TaxID=3028878 RepID=UPI002572826F|nr:heme NO-binding domain-containing protein [Ferrimonas sp. YFM]BDY05813.1 guanylate cyclase [Ferrimonas sp. YFM]
MQGIIFTEFLDLVDNAFGPEVTEAMLERVSPASGGAYTRVGNYDHQEMVQLVVTLSDLVAKPVPDLLYTYGYHLFPRLLTLYPQRLAQCHESFEFLQVVENEIHTQVKKIHANAQVPTFEFPHTEDGYMEVIYNSERGLADVAHGLIAHCCDHFKERVEIAMEDLSGERKTRVSFRLTKQVS